MSEIAAKGGGMSDCDTCAESAGLAGECPLSERPCRHHCNCVWTQDICHWCGAEVGADGDVIPTYAPVDVTIADGVPA